MPQHNSAASKHVSSHAAKETAAAVGKEAAKSGASVPPPSNVPFWQAWTQQLNQQSAKARLGAETWMAGLQKGSTNFKMPKFGMPVNVEIDVLRPMAKTVREAVAGTYLSLPLPVQVGLPYFAVGATSGLLVHKLSRRKLVAERTKCRDLQERVDLLLLENKNLEDRLRDLKSKVSAPRGASEMRMAAAVAEATTAAAAAASAAASAASACSVQMHPSSRRQGKLANA